jgi:hypothetical protein
MMERFQFGSVCFFQCQAFASPEYYIDSNRNCVFMEPNSFLAWLIHSVIMSAVSLSSGTK